MIFRLAMIWIKAHLLPIVPLGTHFSDIWMKTNYSFQYAFENVKDVDNFVHGQMCLTLPFPQSYFALSIVGFYVTVCLTLPFPQSYFALSIVGFHATVFNGCIMGILIGIN